MVDFEDKYKEHLHTINKAVYRYRKFLDNDEVKSCGMIGLFNALRCYNGKSQFTTYLYNHVRWECCNRISENLVSQPLSEYTESSKKFFDLSFLKPEDKRLIYFRYVYRFTLDEIAKITRLSRETVRKQINKIKNRIEMLLLTD